MIGFGVHLLNCKLFDCPIAAKNQLHWTKIGLKCAHARNCDCLRQKLGGRLKDTRLNNRWLLAVVDLAGTGASGLESFNDVQGLLVSDLAEDDVLAIKPAGDDGSNKELGAVAVTMLARLKMMSMRQRAHVFGPALAMDKSPGLVCLRLKFSSANFSP